VIADIARHRRHRKRKSIESSAILQMAEIATPQPRAAVPHEHGWDRKRKS
jgi:hypothetical protein